MLLRSFCLVSITGLSFVNFSLCEDLLPYNFKDDVRYISYEDFKNDAEEFTEDGVISFSELLFDVERKHLFVGARDNVYRLSLDKLKQLDKSLWIPRDETIKMCMTKGQSEKKCHNYIKVLLSNGKKLFICGTYAFSPRCSWRQFDNLEEEQSISGAAKCPYNPKENMTALLTSTGQYFVGSATDFSGSDSAIYSFSSLENAAKHLRTNQYNLQWLNDPQFVGSFEDDTFVYFVFREIALEYSSFGKRIFSRIARVCKNDPGGRMMRDNWSIFVKARLSCSVQGDYPFFYDEIQGMHYLPEQQVLYATFTTSSNSIAGSAICAFSISAIEKAFLGPFKYQIPGTAVWESHEVENKSYVQCQARFIDYSYKYQLMDLEIQATTTKPLHTAVLERYSQIAVATVANKYFEMQLIFVANDAGLIKKISVMPQSDITCLIEIWQPVLNSRDSSIKIMKYLNTTKSLYIGTDNSVIRVPIAKCHRYATNVTCLGAQDPLCGWIERLQACIQVPLDKKDLFEQNFPACPEISTPLDGGWSAWSTWSGCYQSNGSQTYVNAKIHDTQNMCQCQTRKCNKPVPRNGGKPCEGVTINVANCTVHGKWTDWSSWSTCSQSCGVATKFRKRTCGAPKPAYGGRLCVGRDSDEVYCTKNPPCPHPLPIEGDWSGWSKWSACSSACGNGTRWRTRKCDSPPPEEGAPQCPGCATETEICNRHPCKIKQTSLMTPWHSAVTENSDDENYIEKRYEISCKAQGASSVKINISKQEERYCNSDGSCSPNPLPRSLWSAWSSWDTCSVDCGGGYQTSTRLCLQKHCPETESKRQQACNTHSCVDGWGCWSDWSQCSGSHGSESSERRRPCLILTGCKGESVQYRTCPQCEDSKYYQWNFISLLLIPVVIGLVLLIIYKKRKSSLTASTRVPSQSNHYDSEPLRENPRRGRSSSSSGFDSGGSDLNFSKSNNFNSDRNETSAALPKLYPKAMAGEYETATMKRNSNLRNNRTDFEEEKFY